MNMDAAAPPPRKKPRRGKRKSKAERLARGLSANADEDAAPVSMEQLQELLDAPTSTTSLEWDQAQAIALRIGTADAKKLMLRTLVFDRHAPRAAVHYAKRLRITQDELLDVLSAGRVHAAKCLAVARFLADADANILNNSTRIDQFIVPWLDAHKHVADASDDTAQENDHGAKQQPPSAFFTSARIVLQPQGGPGTTSALDEDKRALQRALVAKLVVDKSAHTGVLLQYASAFAPVLGDAVHTVDGMDGELSSVWTAEILQAETQRRVDIAARVEKSLQLLWPDARVVVFGSSSTGLLVPDGSGSSVDDVDFCVILPTCPQFLEDTAPVVADIKDHLSLYVADDAIAVTRARVPIVRWTDPQSGLECDLCVNNLPALWNTRLTMQLVDGLDSIVHQFSVWMKRWYKAHRSDGGFASALSSYGMQLLVLYFLQRTGIVAAGIDCGDCVLDADALKQLDEGEITRRIELAVAGATSPPTQRPVSLWSLVVEFFAFYGTSGFDFEHGVVSLRDVAATKAQRHWVRRTWRYSLAIEDPIETKRDLGTLFSRVSLTRFRVALVAACICIAEAHQSNEALDSSDRIALLESLLVVSPK